VADTAGRVVQLHANEPDVENAQAEDAGAAVAVAGIAMN